MSSNPTDAAADPTIQIIKVYCLVKLTESQQASYERQITEADSEQLGHIRPQFIPWPEDRDGTLEDMYRIWKAKQEDIFDHFYFIDRHALFTTSIIVAMVDEYAMMYCDKALEIFNGYLVQYPVEGLDEIHPFHFESLEDDAAERGLTYGRVPASALKIIWANLDLANMSMSDCVEFHGNGLDGMGVVEMIPNPDWDPEAFMGKLREAETPEHMLRSGNQRSVL